jgi:hypothetical protein
VGNVVADGGQKKDFAHPTQTSLYSVSDKYFGLVRNPIFFKNRISLIPKY